MDLEEVIEVVNRYLEKGTPAEALTRLKDLEEELGVIREALTSDVKRADAAFLREGGDR
jgi:hypothetical protein